MAEKLDQRYTYPTEADSYYFDNSINPYAYDKNLMPNCTTYAYGRFLESGGSPTVFGNNDNAGNWYPYAKGSKGQTPKVGAILCHEKSGEFGHVAFVEEIVSDNEIIVSDSQYHTNKNINRDDDVYWRRRSRKNDDGNWGGYAGGYVFQGFIYNTVEFDNTPTGGDSGGGDTGGNEGGETGGNTSSGSTSTSGTVVLNNKKSTYGNPYAYYTVTLTPSNRTNNSVTVKCNVSASLATSASSVSGGVTCGLYIGGTWHDFTLISGTWSGISTAFASANITVTGVPFSQTSITGIQFRAVSHALNSNAGLNATLCSNLSISSISGGDTGGDSSGDSGEDLGGTKIIYHPNGGNGESDVITSFTNFTYLIDCPFTDPNEGNFTGWLIWETYPGGMQIPSVYSPGTKYYHGYVDTIAYAQWSSGTTGGGESPPDTGDEDDYEPPPSRDISVYMYKNITVQLIGHNLGNDDTEYIFHTFTSTDSITTTLPDTDYYSITERDIKNCNLRLVIYPEVGYERIDCTINGVPQTFFDINREGICFEINEFKDYLCSFFASSPMGSVYIDNNSSFDSNSHYCLIDTDGSGFEYYIPYITVDDITNTTDLFPIKSFSTFADSSKRIIYKDKKCTEVLMYASGRENLIATEVSLVVADDPYFGIVVKVRYFNTVGWIKVHGDDLYTISCTAYGKANAAFSTIKAGDELVIATIGGRSIGSIGVYCLTSKVNGKDSNVWITLSSVDLLPYSQFEPDNRYKWVELTAE